MNQRMNIRTGPAVLLAGVAIVLAACSAGNALAGGACDRQPGCIPAGIGPGGLVVRLRPGRVRPGSRRHVRLCHGRSCRRHGDSTRFRAATAPPAATQLTETDNGRSVVAQVGSDVKLLLHNTYWQLLGSSNAAVLTLVSGPTYSAAGPIACIPAPAAGP